MGMIDFLLSHLHCREIIVIVEKYQCWVLYRDGSIHFTVPEPKKVVLKICQYVCTGWGTGTEYLKIVVHGH